MDPHSRAPKKSTSHGNEVLPQDTTHLHKQFPPFSLFSTALWDLANSRPVHSLMLSSHVFFCLSCRLAPLIVPCKMVLARPNEQETCPYHCSLRLFNIVRRSCGPIACWTSSLVAWSVYMMNSILIQSTNTVQNEKDKQQQSNAFN